jgi:CCR4-NOT transcription complex subunit 4
MHQGKHQEYEKRLHDALIAQMSQQPQPTALGTAPATTATSTTSVVTAGTLITTAATTQQPLTNLLNGSAETGSGTSINGKGVEPAETNGQTNGIQSKDAWPSLSTSPVNNKENKLNGKTSEYFFVIFVFNFCRKH